MEPVNSITSETTYFLFFGAVRDRFFVLSITAATKVDINN